MQYRQDKYGNQLSILGYGCMRFTQGIGGINLAKAEEELMTAFRAGVNYYDTAYIYPGSEAALGEILEKNNIRDQVYIATKLPHYMIKTPEQMDKYFDEELRRLRTDHVDYYLMHMLTDMKAWERLQQLGIIEWLESKKASGQIRQVGYSYHGNSDMFIRLLDAYPWDFCQVQYNYMDENSQAGRTGVEAAEARGIPVIIMEPLRGGRLVNLPADVEDKMAAHTPAYKPAEWSFRWLWDQPAITVVLSGMNSIEMVQQNCGWASTAEAHAFTEADQKFLKQMLDLINAKVRVGCTGCRYCMPCPKNVDIPGTFAAYNRMAAEGWFSGMKEYFMCTGVRHDYTGASNCIGCGKCEAHCPQHLPIREELKNAKKALEGPIYKIARKLVPLFMKY